VFPWAEDNVPKEFYLPITEGMRSNTSIENLGIDGTHQHECCCIIRFFSALNRAGRREVMGRQLAPSSIATNEQWLGVMIQAFDAFETTED
jgi:hypothetical protein